MRYKLDKTVCVLIQTKKEPLMLFWDIFAACNFPFKKHVWIEAHTRGKFYYTVHEMRSYFNQYSNGWPFYYLQLYQSSPVDLKRHFWTLLRAFMGLHSSDTNWNSKQIKCKLNHTFYNHFENVLCSSDCPYSHQQYGRTKGTNQKNWRLLKYINLLCFGLVVVILACLTWGLTVLFPQLL